MHNCLLNINMLKLCKGWSYSGHCRRPCFNSWTKIYQSSSKKSCWVARGIYQIHYKSTHLVRLTEQKILFVTTSFKIGDKEASQSSRIVKGGWNSGQAMPKWTHIFFWWSFPGFIIYILICNSYEEWCFKVKVTSLQLKDDLQQQLDTEVKQTFVIHIFSPYICCVDDQKSFAS